MNNKNKLKNERSHINESMKPLTGSLAGQGPDVTKKDKGENTPSKSSKQKK